MGMNSPPSFLQRTMVSRFVGLRYTRAKRRNQFISFVSGFSLVGMALGALALIVVMSVMNGFDLEIKQRLLKVIPHGVFQADAPIQHWQQLSAEFKKEPDLLAVEPYSEGFGMISYERSMHGVQLKGILPDEHMGQTLTNNMLVGSLGALQAGEYNVVIGRLLARSMGVTTGDKIELTLPQLSITPAGIFPRMKRFTIVGVFEVGGQADQGLILMHLNDTQKLLRQGDGVTGLAVYSADMYGAENLVNQLNKKIQSLSNQFSSQNIVGQDWSKTQSALFSAVKMEKTVVSVLLMVIVAVAAFNIISSLVLMVSDKRTDIAVLRTLGLTQRQVMSIFVVQGFVIGATGIFTGTILGVLGALYIGDIIAFWESLTGLMVFDPNVYFISHMPSELQWPEVILVVLVGLCLSFLSTLYPALRAAKIEPAEALRYE